MFTAHRHVGRCARGRSAVNFSPGDQAGDILIFTAPVRLPALILLDLLPRFLLRKREVEASPTAVTMLMILYWWGLTLAAFTLEGDGGSGPLPSTLGNLVRWLPKRLEQGLYTAGILLALGGWIGAIVSAIIVRRQRRNRSTQPQSVQQQSPPQGSNLSRWLVPQH